MRRWMRDAVALGWRGALVLALGLSLVAAWQGGAAVAQDGPAGALAIRDHLTTGFPLVGAHQNIRCETCHVRGIFKNTPKTCEGCHTPSARISNVTIASSHVPTVQPCSVCHNQLSFAGARFNHSGVVPGACSSCHNANNAPGKPSGHVVTGSSCDTCHRTSTWAGAGFDHAQVVPGTCASCHNGAVAAGRTPNHIPTAQACDSCHTNTVSFATWTMNHSGIVSDCASCHGGRFVDVKAKPATHIPTSSSCETCHLSMSTFTLAAFKHQGIASGCASCHDGKLAGGKPGVHIPTAAPCESCHKSTTGFATVTMDHSGIATGCAACHGGQFGDVKTKPSTHLPTAAACETCHGSTASFKVASFNHTGIASGCAACHDGKTATGKPALHIPTQAPCESCHKSTTVFSTLTMDHTGIVSGCAACHGGQFGDVRAQPTTAHIPTLAPCESCHRSTTVFSTWTMNHGGIATGCATCHGGQFADVKTKPSTHLQTAAACETCHSSTASFKVASFNHTGIASGCAVCHDGKTATGKPTAHILTQAPCEACHKSTAAFATLTMDHTGIASGCASCHGGQFGDVVSLPPAHVPTAAACETCHVPTKFTNFSGGTMNHQGIASGCAACHASGKTFVGVTVVTPPATHIPFAGAPCETCHAPSKFGSFGGTAMSHGPVSGIACATCHESGRTWYGVTIVTRPSPGQDPNHPLTGECGSCHTSTTSFATGIVAGKPANHIPTNETCALCHANPANYAAYTMSHQNITSGCATCHATGLSFANIVPVSPPATHLPFASAACETCHAPGKFTNFSGTAMNHAAVPGIACAICHGPGKAFFGIAVVTPPATHIPFAGAPCDACHAPTKFTNFSGTSMSHGPVSAISCATCHEAGKTWYGVTIVTRPSLAKDPNHPIGGECGVCHSSTSSFATGVTGGKPSNHIPTNRECTLCHSNPANYQVFAMSHDGITGSCAACHGPGLAFANIVPKAPPATHIPWSGAACEGCHASGNFNSFGSTQMSHGPVSGIACATCHEAGKSWFGVTIVTRPTPAADPNHPTTGECGTCHTSTQSFATGIQGLPANHIPTSQACTLCHHNPGGVMKPGIMDHTGITTNCTQCHLAAPAGKVFLGVTPVAQGNGHVPTSASCDTCHSGFQNFSGGQMKHTGISSGCATCHATGKTFTGVNIVTPPPTHIPSGGAACEGCHASGNFNSFGSTQMSHGPVSGIACASCHETGKSWFGVTIVTRPTAAQDPAHPATGDCGTCHTSTTSFSTGVQGLPANHIPTSQTCTLCHHNPGGVMKPGIMDHQGITSNCTQCHLAAPAGKAFLGVTPVAQGNGHIPTSASCERCHSGFAKFSGGKMDHTGIASGCATCHASGKSFAGVTVVTPPATHIPFAGAACEVCHLATKFTNFGSTPMNHAAVTSISCATCHGANKTWFGAPPVVTLPQTGHIPNPSALDCNGCHTSTTSFKTWKMSHSGITTGCFNCHGGQFTGVKSKPKDHPTTSNVCESCHSVNSFDKMLLLPPGKALLVGTAKPSGAASPSAAAVVLKPAPAAAGNPHLGVAPGSCAGCHNGVTAAAKPGRHLATALSCDNCHRTSAWVPASFTHRGVVPATCATCHNGSTARARPSGHFTTTRSCDSCHRMTSWLPPMPYRHLTPAYSPHPGVACVTCHKGNSEMVVWRFPAAKPECAGCHQNMARPGLKPGIPRVGPARAI